jgi:sporulation protein YlmC with PRC-barrel domain
MSLRGGWVLAAVAALGLASSGLMAQERGRPEGERKGAQVEESQSGENGARKGSEAQKDPRKEPGKGSEAAQAHAGVKASKVIGERVKNQKGDELGTIQEIVIEGQNGRIVYVVLSYGGFLGLGDKLFAIPWDALSHTEGQEFYVLDVDRDQLQAAPGFDKDHWPDTADPRWGSEVHRSYGAGAGAEAGGQERASEGRVETSKLEAESAKLPLKLEKGQTCAFQVDNAGLMRVAGSKTPQSGSYKEALGQLRFQVKDTSFIRGESTVVVTFDPSILGSVAQTGGQGQNREMSLTLKVGSDGRIRQVSAGPTGASSAVPAQLGKHLAFVFGAGLHDRTLEVGRLYSLPAVTTESQGQSSPRASTGAGSKEEGREKVNSTPRPDEPSGNVQLRYEGKAKVGGEELAKFTLVTPVSDSAPGGRVTQTGEAWYRMKDGLLERMSMEKQGAASDLSPSSQERSVR